VDSAEGCRSCELVAVFFALSLARSHAHANSAWGSRGAKYRSRAALAVVGHTVCVAQPEPLCADYARGGLCSRTENESGTGLTGCALVHCLHLLQGIGHGDAHAAYAFIANLAHFLRSGSPDQVRRLRIYDAFVPKLHSPSSSPDTRSKLADPPSTARKTAPDIAETARASCRKQLAVAMQQRNFAHLRGK
jgi:hypothetical protein